MFSWKLVIGTKAYEERVYDTKPPDVRQKMPERDVEERHERLLLRDDEASIRSSGDGRPACDRVGESPHSGEHASRVGDASAGHPRWDSRERGTRDGTRARRGIRLPVSRLQGLLTRHRFLSVLAPRTTDSGAVRVPRGRSRRSDARFPSSRSDDEGVTSGEGRGGGFRTRLLRHSLTGLIVSPNPSGRTLEDGRCNAIPVEVIRKGSRIFHGIPPIEGERGTDSPDGPSPSRDGEIAIFYFSSKKPSREESET